MIARIALPIILVVLLTHGYVDRRFWCRLSTWKRGLCWLVPLAVVAFTVWMALQPDYFPADVTLLTAYLAVICCYVVPLVLLQLCSFLGSLLRHRPMGEAVGWLLALLAVFVFVHGVRSGFRELEVVSVELSFDDLPPAFDGYRVAQFSDAHVGTYAGGRQRILRRAIDSINALHPDLIVFTGDLQNMRPQEIDEHRQLLASLQARDGVCSVLGNHDYAEYTADSPDQKQLCCQLTREKEQDLGWHLLANSHRVIRRGQDSIVVAGMENDGEGRFPQLGDVQGTLQGVDRRSFVVMLEHDPTSWHRKILPQSYAQLTLSGHTHGGQLSLLGWSPVSLRYRECQGLYHEGPRALYVSKGLGGVIPWRFGTPGEVVVLTLRRGANKS